MEKEGNSYLTYLCQSHIFFKQDVTLKMFMSLRNFVLFVVSLRMCRNRRYGIFVVVCLLLFLLFYFVFSCCLCVRFVLFVYLFVYFFFFFFFYCYYFFGGVVLFFVVLTTELHFAPSTERRKWKTLYLV